MNVGKLLSSLGNYVSLAVIAAAGFLIIFGFVNIAQNRSQQESLDEQVAKTNELVQQVKALSEENKKISQTAANYAYCNAVILAKYTETNEPIKIEDLDKCKFNSFPNNTVGANTDQSGSSVTVSNDQGEVAAASSNIPTNSFPNQTGNTQPSGNAPIPSFPEPTTPVPQNPNPTPAAREPLLALDASPLPLQATVYTPCVGIQSLLYLGCSEDK